MEKTQTTSKGDSDSKEGAENVGKNQYRYFSIELKCILLLSIKDFAICFNLKINRVLH